MGTIRIQSSSTEKNFAGLAAWYALQRPRWQPKPEDDIKFVRHCFATLAQRSVCDVLEVGCCDGSLLVPLAAQRYAMTGLEIAEAALSRCRKELEVRKLTATLIQGDMETLDVAEKYDAVLAIDSVPNYLLEDEQIIGLFTRFHRALRPGGIVVLDIWNMLGQWAVIDQPITYTKTIEGDTVEFRERFHIDSLRGHMHARLQATVHGQTDTTYIDHEEVLRITTANEMKMLLRAAGFTSIQVYPHHEEPDEPEDNPEQLWFVAVRGTF